MTAQADLIRDRRRAFALPGGAHDRLIAFLAKALPAAIGLIAAIMIIAPLSPRGEVSFLLDRNKVAITRERIAVDRAMYRGQDKRGRAFEVTAGKAVQGLSDKSVIHLEQLVARLVMSDGPAEIRAPSGLYDYHAESISVQGPVNFSAADGYRLTTQNVAIDLKQQRVVGSGGLAGAVPTGTFSADSIVADLEARTVALEGNARLRMTPGKLRVPK